MKKLLSILLFGVMLLAFTSCADDGGGGGTSSGFPTYIPDPDGDDSITELGFNYFLAIRKTYDRYFEVELLSLVEPEDCELTLNGEEMSFDWDYEDYFWWFSLEEDELEGIDFNAGETIDYYLKINNKIYEGELEILAYLDVNWPEFCFDEDFNFDWDIDEDPHIYNIFMDFDCENDSVYKSIVEIWQIDGSDDEFSISNDLYENYEDCDWYDFYMHLSAINYVNHGKCLAWSETDADNGWWEDELNINSNREINPKEKIQRTIEIFKKKFNK